MKKKERKNFNSSVRHYVKNIVIANIMLKMSISHHYLLKIVEFFPTSYVLFSILYNKDKVTGK